MKDRGTTLVEMALSLSVMTVAGIIFLSVLLSVQRSADTEAARSEANDELRLAAQGLDHAVRSASSIDVRDGALYVCSDFTDEIWIWRFLDNGLDADGQFFPRMTGTIELTDWRTVQWNLVLDKAVYRGAATARNAQPGVPC